MRRSLAILAIVTVAALEAAGQPPPAAVVEPAPPPVVVQPVPVPAVPCPPAAIPVPTSVVPAPVPVERVPVPVLIQGQRFVPPTVTVLIPGPPIYGPGPFLVSRYNPLGGPPYALPVFVEEGVAPGTVRVQLSYVEGRPGEIVVVAPGNATFPADVGVRSVTDSANGLVWDVKKITVSPDRRQMTIGVVGKGLASKASGKAPESGSVTVTLSGSGTLPTLPAIPVTYVGVR